MEPYVDWFGFMAYDLHGSWDANVKTIGALVRAQSDLRDIANNTFPLWFDALDPAKINLGLAYYGRGYTLSNRSCNYMGCPFNGPSKPAPCTNFEGVMSHREIKQLIQDKNLKPALIEEAQIKQLTWDDQWIGYDDHETLAAKVRFADSLCMGGHMIWSIDFDSGPGSGDVPDGIFSSNTSGTTAGGGDNPGSGSGGNSGGSSFDTGNATGLVYVDPSIWTDSQPLVACIPPCVLILPPLQLGSTTVITFPPLTTTYIVETTPGAGNGDSSTLLTVTTAVPIPPITTTEIEIWAITIFTNDTTATTFSPVQSVMPPPVTATFPIPPWELPSTTEFSTDAPSSEETILYPDPTFSVTLPSLPTISYTRGPPKATCTSHCGHHSCKPFGCGGPCLLFGCAGNCGLFGCGGGCGIAGCGGPCGIFPGCGGCSLIGCGKACPGCGYQTESSHGGQVDGQEDDDQDDDDEEDDDEDDDQIDDDEEEDEDEDEIETCVLQILGEGLDDSDPPADQVDGSTALSLTGAMSTAFITPAPAQVTEFTTTTTTTTPLITPLPNRVQCFQEYEFADFHTILSKMTGGWVADGGKKLRKEVSGCGSMTGWHWTKDKNDGQGATVSFRTQPLMKFGCVERAIRSAGGPSVSCYAS